MTGRFVFCKGVNTLIGENASGKTNALFALRLLLDDTLSRNATRLRETDFCRALGNWHGHWIIISLDFEEVDPSEGCQLLKHETGHMDESNAGTFTLYFRPKLEVRNRLFQMTDDDTDHPAIQEYLDGLTVDDYEPVLTGRARANFLNDGVYSQLVGDFENYSFPNPNDDDQELLGVRMGTIHSEITCTFAQALRDVIADLRGYRSNPLLALLRGTESTIQIEDAARIINTVAQLNTDISALPEIKRIATGVQKTLHSTVGQTYSPSVSIESALPDRLEKILQRLSVTVGDDAGSGYRGDLVEQSLGGANLIYLALKLLEYELKLSSDKVAHFLLIEEPEAHIHTHIQKTLFERQSTKRTQVIVSTHSTHISSAAKIGSVNVFAKRMDHAEVYQPAAGLSDLAAGRVERYLDAVRSTLLFAKGVILVEGEAELVMIPEMIRATLGMSLDEMGISVIAMNSAFFEHVAIMFHDDRIQRRCAIVTDLDTAVIDLPGNSEEDDPDQKHARESQIAGKRRHDSLEGFTENNSWVSGFFAQYTFEVDFLQAENVREVEEVVDKIYTRRQDKERVKKALKSEDLLISGMQILKLANKVGKGWFALLLSESLHVDTFVLKYILRAVAFAADNVTRSMLKHMALFRLKDEFFDDEIRKAFPSITDLREMEPQAFINLYRKTAPEDDLSEFVGYLEEYAKE
jgi:predicted ATP-dependent endonuclease of OLD family